MPSASLPRAVGELHAEALLVRHAAAEDRLRVRRLALYATGGGALGEVGTNATAASGSFVATDNRSQTREGWTLGGGVEVEIARGWSAKIEYLYLDLGSRTRTYLLNPLISNMSHFSANVITTGVNYHF